MGTTNIPARGARAYPAGHRIGARSQGAEGIANGVDMKRLRDVKLAPVERKALHAFSRQLKESLGKRLVSLYLFGSKARGDFQKDSDLDVYILVRKKSGIVARKISKVTADVLDDYDVLVSPVSYDLREEEVNVRMRSFFFEAVRKEGIAI